MSACLLRDKEKPTHPFAKVLKKFKDIHELIQCILYFSILFDISIHKVG